MADIQFFFMALSRGKKNRRVFVYLSFRNKVFKLLSHAIVKTIFIIKPKRNKNGRRLKLIVTVKMDARCTPNIFLYLQIQVAKSLQKS